MPRYPHELGPYIEVTCLDPNATYDEIRALVADAVRYQVAAVCVYPYWLPMVVDALAPSGIPVATVVSYPHGMDMLDAKLEQIDLAQEDGATEVNVILNPHFVNERQWYKAQDEVRAMLGHNPGVTIKAALNVSRLSANSLQTAAFHLSALDVHFLGLFSEGDHPQREDVATARAILNSTNTELLAMGDYTHNLAALRAINSGARRVSARFPARLVGAP